MDTSSTPEIQFIEHPELPGTPTEIIGVAFGKRPTTYIYAQPFLSRATAFAWLASHGIERAEVAFSGGEDEGGADSVTFIHPGEKPPIILESPYKMLPEGTGGFSMLFVAGRGFNDGYQATTPLTNDQLDAIALYDTFTKPVYDRHGSFAGGGEGDYVSGTVIWDVATTRVRIDESWTREGYGYDDE